LPGHYNKLNGELPSKEMAGFLLSFQRVKQHNSWIAK